MIFRETPGFPEMKIRVTQEKSVAVYNNEDLNSNNKKYRIIIIIIIIIIINLALK
jgi:hypothetical protein